MKYLVLLLLFAGVAHAQRIAPGRAMGFTHAAKLQLDSIAELTRKTQKEQAACVTVSVMQDTAWVVAKLGPPKNMVGSDDLGITVTGDLCEWWQPVLHSHVRDNGWLYIPSEIDQHTSAARGVFGVLLSVEPNSWKLKAYP